MKRNKKKLTRAEKQKKFKTIATWLRAKKELNRSQVAKGLNDEFQILEG